MFGSLAGWVTKCLLFLSGGYRGVAGGFSMCWMSYDDTVVSTKCMRLLSEVKLYHSQNSSIVLGILTSGMAHRSGSEQATMINALQPCRRPCPGKRVGPPPVVDAGLHQRKASNPLDHGHGLHEVCVEDTFHTNSRTSTQSQPPHVSSSSPVHGKLHSVDSPCLRCSVSSRPHQHSLAHWVPENLKWCPRQIFMHSCGAIALGRQDAREEGAEEVSQHNK